MESCFTSEVKFQFHVVDAEELDDLSLVLRCGKMESCPIVIVLEIEVNTKVNQVFQRDCISD